MIDTLEALTALMRQGGAERIYAKKLAPNDNSKNQVYLGGDFSVLNIIPHGSVETDISDTAGSVRDRAKASVKFRWIDEEGHYAAPYTQLILYPKYPEVRMSGFLKGCRNAPSSVMGVRDVGRVLFLGVTHNGCVLGYAAAANSPLANAVHELKSIESVGVFVQIPVRTEFGNTRSQLLEKLGAIYSKHWILSKKLGADGIARDYAARNGGGYTLEAELGIAPNGYSEPDFLGWEVKQYGVRDFKNYRPLSPVTLFTPEPTGGFYREKGVEEFVLKFGYPDKNGKAGRLNFGGVYSSVKSYHADTGLQLRLTGYDFESGKITDFNQGIVLLDKQEEIAALWQYTEILSHWNRKHAQAVYVPSLFKNPPPQYRYGPSVQLCERTDLTLFLKAVAMGVVYYDPAIKLESDDAGRVSIKRRSQFRIKHDNLEKMYHETEWVQLVLQGS
ncbi:MAG: hypothetical protein GX768_02460 [Chloroflexi bacterium]|nr:hypothetical protein [Chloroflexota bacterium]